MVHVQFELLVKIIFNLIGIDYMAETIDIGG